MEIIKAMVARDIFPQYVLGEPKTKNIVIFQKPERMNRTTEIKNFLKRILATGRVHALKTFLESNINLKDFKAFEKVYYPEDVFSKSAFWFAELGIDQGVERIELSQVLRRADNIVLVGDCDNIKYALRFLGAEKAKPNDPVTVGKKRVLFLPNGIGGHEEQVKKVIK